MYKKLSAEEFTQLRIKGWGRSSPTYNAIMSLKVGEALVILKSQWYSNTKTPSTQCRRIEKKFAAQKLKLKCVALEDNSGWAVQRIA